MKEFFITTIYQPLYNILVFFIDFVPGHNVFWATVLLTIFVKVALLPLAKKAMISQIKMKGIQEDVKKLQNEHDGTKEELTREIMALYKDKKVNPFSPILIILIQLPIILSLYFIFKSGLPGIDVELLYSFIPFPLSVDMVYFGIDLAGKSILLAALTGITQFFYIRRTFSKNNTTTSDNKTAADIQKALSFQFTYIMPFVITFIAYTLPAVISIYWITSNIFAYIQDIYIRNHTDKLGIS
jgi:YidC/Oxa1 family membrane protein insertase